MKRREFFERLRRGALTRRDFHKGLAAAGLASVTLPLVSRPALAADLTVFTWEGYNDPQFYGAYLAEHGADPEFGIFGEEEEAFQKLRAGYKADTAHPCTQSVRRWKDAGLLKPIDTSRIEQWDRIFPSFLKLRGVNMDGDFYLMPWDWGNESIAYRPDLVDIQEESYALFLDERYKGRLATFDSVDTMAYLGGLLSGAKNPYDMTEEEMQKAADVFRKIHQNLRFYWTDAGQLAQALASGEIVAGTAWNETPATLRSEGVEVKYMRPKEGIMTWVCGVCLLKDGPGKEDLAYDFLNAMLDPQTGANLITNYNYGHSNRDSLKLVDAELLDELGFADAESFLESGNFVDEMPAETREKLIGMFDEIKAGF